jgi:hypothetical protein
MAIVQRRPDEHVDIACVSRGAVKRERDRLAPERQRHTAARRSGPQIDDARSRFGGESAASAAARSRSIGSGMRPECFTTAAAAQHPRVASVIVTGVGEFERPTPSTSPVSSMFDPARD